VALFSALPHDDEVDIRLSKSPHQANAKCDNQSETDVFHQADLTQLATVPQDG
jgi:hypothetical protein